MIHEHSEDDEKMCRYCFGDEDEEELISPCACKGGQKYVHLSCLRRWQRMVLVSQPTHPAYYKDDERHHICNVCKSEFTCPPPTRLELMSSFTGAEIGALIEPNCMIGARDFFTEMMLKQMRENPLATLGAGYKYWINGAYLITKVVEDDGVILLPCNTFIELSLYLTQIDKDTGHFCFGGRNYVIDPSQVPAGFKGTSREWLEGLIKTRSSLIMKDLRFKSVDPLSCAHDKIHAVSLTRQIKEIQPFQKQIVDPIVNALDRKYPQLKVKDVKVDHFIGGPCDTEKILQCIVLGRGQHGYTVMDDFAKAMLLAAQNSQKPNEEAGEFTSGQVVTIQGLQNQQQLNGEDGICTTYNKTSKRWIVMVLSTNEKKMIKPENLVVKNDSNLEISNHGTVLAFWGDAEWRREQLLGEIAKGHWGLCKSSLLDLVRPISERRKALDGRLVYAPNTEMTDEYIKSATTEMERVRREAMDASRAAEMSSSSSFSSPSSS